MILKTKKQGDTITIEIPKEFGIKEDVLIEPKLLENDLFFEFVETEKEFFDFAEDILASIISEGYEQTEILQEFQLRKEHMKSILTSIASDTTNQAKVMTKEELKSKIDL